MKQWKINLREHDGRGQAAGDIIQQRKLHFRLYEKFGNKKLQEDAVEQANGNIHVRSIEQIMKPEIKRWREKERLTEKYGNQKRVKVY